MERLDELTELMERATPGPWQTDGLDNDLYDSPIWSRANLSQDEEDDEGYLGEMGKADAAYIVALVNAAPALIEAARERDALEKALRVAETALTALVCN